MSVQGKKYFSKAGGRARSQRDVFPLTTSLYTTTYTTCISTHRNITVENMSEKSFGNNPTHQNSSSQISAAGTARPALPLRKLYGIRLGLAGITLALMAQTLLAIFLSEFSQLFPGVYILTYPRYRPLLGSADHRDSILSAVTVFRVYPRNQYRGCAASWA